VALKDITRTRELTEKLNFIFNISMLTVLKGELKPYRKRTDAEGTR